MTSRVPGGQADADLSLLVQWGEQLASSLDLPEVLSNVSRRLLEVVPAWRVGVMLLEPDGFQLQLLAGSVRDSDPRAFPRGLLLPLSRYPEVAHAVLTRQSVDVQDVGADPRVSGVRDVLLAAGIHSLHVVPLVAGERVVGALSIGQREGDPPLSEHERELCRAVAQQAAFAVRNAQLFGEVQGAARELEGKVKERTRRLRDSALRLSVLNEITTVLNQSLDIDRILEASLVNLRRLENVERAQVYLGRAGASTFTAYELDAGGGLASCALALPPAPEPGPVALLTLAGRSVAVRADDTEAPAPRSHLLVPLVSKDGVVGALQVFSSRPAAHGDEDLELLQQVAGDISIALERSDLYHAAQVRSKQFEVLSNLGRELTGALTLENFLPTAASLIRRSFDYTLVTVLVTEPVEGELIVAGVSSADPAVESTVAGHHQPRQAGICGAALANGVAVNVPDVHADARFLGTDALATRSELAIPIRVAGQVIGVLDLQSDRLAAFGPGDVAVASMLADQVAAALQASRLIEAAERERQFTERILENLTGGLIVTDRRRVVQVVNARGAEILRLSRGDLVGRDLLEVLPTAAPLFEFSLDQVSRDCVVELRDGARVPVGFSNAFFVDARSHREGVILAFRDLSEVRALQRKVRQAERLAAIGTVAAGVAHEIRNPLFGISATAQILLSELPPESELAELCRAMLGETRRLNDLVTSLLQYGRPQELRLSPVSPCRLLDDVVTQVRPRAEESGCRLVHACPADDRTIMADADQVKQVLLNLAVNAVEAAPRGTVELGAAWAPDGEGVELFVKDDGPGLSPGEIDKVFDLFYTTKPTGSGLGLAISSKIVEEHGGSIGVTSHPGGGARFGVRLPVRRTAAS